MYGLPSRKSSHSGGVGTRGRAVRFVVIGPRASWGVRYWGMQVASMAGCDFERRRPGFRNDSVLTEIVRLRTGSGRGEDRPGKTMPTSVTGSAAANSTLAV